MKTVVNSEVKIKGT